MKKILISFPTKPSNQQCNVGTKKSRPWDNLALQPDTFLQHIQKFTVSYSQ